MHSAILKDGRRINQLGRKYMREDSDSKQQQFIHGNIYSGRATHGKRVKSSAPEQRIPRLAGF